MEYIAADLIAFIVWIVLFISRKDLQKEMLIMSFLAAPIALFDILFVPIYWVPKTLFNIPVGIEGVIFSFLIGGIASVAYQEVNRKKLIKFNKFHRNFSILIFLIFLPTFLVLTYVSKINVEISMLIAMSVGIAGIIFVRKDLLKSSIIGGLIFGLIYFLAISIWLLIFPDSKNWFILDGLPKVFILSAPIYEIIFAILFGAYWGNLYELIFGYRFKK